MEKCKYVIIIISILGRDTAMVGCDGCNKTVDSSDDLVEVLTKDDCSAHICQECYDEYEGHFEDLF